MSNEPIPGPVGRFAEHGPARSDRELDQRPALTERQLDLLALLIHAELVSLAGDLADYNRELMELRKALGIDPGRGREVLARGRRAKED